MQQKALAATVPPVTTDNQVRNDAKEPCFNKMFSQPIVPQAPPPGHVSLVSTGGAIDRGAGLLPAPPLSDGVVPVATPPTTVVSFTPLQPTATGSRSTGLLSTPIEVTVQ